MEMAWLQSLLLVLCLLFSLQSAEVPWRRHNVYPKRLEHVQVYVTSHTHDVTGERALTQGCGSEGKPYKYRGQGHLPELRKVMEGRTSKVWVGAVRSTTPWTWIDGRQVYRGQGLTTSPLPPATPTVTIPANNVFLCSLHCGPRAYILLQGNRCACSETTPEALTPDLDPGLTWRCPGTYQDRCGTGSAYSVYTNTLSPEVRWEGLDEESRHYGTAAFLQRPDTPPTQPLSLGAEVDVFARRGYICNGTLLNVGDHHVKHVWSQHADAAALTWRDARQACMNQGRELVTLSRDAQACLPEVRQQTKGGERYWVGVSRQLASLWLDGTQVKTKTQDNHQGQSGCLTLTFTGKRPTFTFESCTGVKLPVLCERDPSASLPAFTHDDRGNHIVTHTNSADDYSSTVALLGGVLAVLSLMTTLLVLLLCNRNKWMPPKSPSPPRKRRVWHTETDPRGTVPAGGGVDSPGSQRSPRSLHPPPPSRPRPCPHEPAGYAVVSKGKVALLGSRSRSDEDDRDLSSRSRSGEVDPGYLVYTAKTEWGCLHRGDSSPYSPCPAGGVDTTPGGHRPSLCLREESSDPAREAQIARVGTDQPPSKPADGHVDSGRSSTGAGSEDSCYSALTYRRALRHAWAGLQHSAAYAHVSLHPPASGHAPRGDDDASLYDVAQMMTQPVRCIDNDYDHAEPGVCGFGRRLDLGMLDQIGGKNESHV